MDRDGTIYRTTPENVICRHTIGLNHFAIGIENVGCGADDLTREQAEANAALVSSLTSRHPSIRYLIGHHEYRDNRRPHHCLFREADPSYRLTAKIDPGPAFMAQVRRILAERYGIVPEE